MYLTYECDPEAEEAPKVVTIERGFGGRLLPRGLPGVTGPTSETLKIKLSACARGVEPTDPVRNKTIEIRLKTSGLTGLDHTGGHDHGGNRPLGKIEWEGSAKECKANDGDACKITCRTDDQGTCTVTYTASEFSGSVMMNAKYPDEEGVEQDVVILVGVTLAPLGTSSYYTLTGSSGTTTVGKCPGHAIEHPGNHFARPNALMRIQQIALDYYLQTQVEGEGGQKLGINDMSLPFGGRFDICGDWESPHTQRYGHPVGLGVDIDGSALDTNTGRYVGVKQRRLDKLAFEAGRGGVRAPEAAIHYTFPQQ